MSPLVPPGLGLELLHHGSLNPVFKSPSNIFNADLYMQECKTAWFRKHTLITPFLNSQNKG